MSTLHLVPGMSAAGCLMMALRNAGRDETVLPFPDNLSYGPIDADEDDAAARWKWWSWQFIGNSEDLANATRDFWQRVTTTEDGIVVWWARHSPQDCSFFSAIAARLADHPFDAIDVTGTQHTFIGRDSTSLLSEPAEEVSTMRHEGLGLLFDTKSQVTAVQRERYGTAWRQLCRENAPFRIVAETGLVSASIDHFDALILRNVNAEWRRLDRVLWAAFSDQHPYSRISDGMLLMRLSAMVDDGRVLADHYPLNVRTGSVRLAEGQ